MPDKSDSNSNQNGAQDSDSAQSAAITQISLSQALLAPLDAIFKAQVHSARSFVNLILQLGYEPKKENDPESGKPIYLDFVHEIEDGSERKQQKLSIPALAAIPISPLAIESAEFQFALNVETTANHSQVQKSRDEGLTELNRSKRPWFLVDQPISVRGTLASGEQSDNNNATKSTSAIQISVKVGPAKIPAGLNKFITSLSELSSMSDVPQTPLEEVPPNNPGEDAPEKS